MLLPPGEAEAPRKDETGIKNARRNYHRRSIFELGPKGNGFFRVRLRQWLHCRLGQTSDPVRSTVLGVNDSIFGQVVQRPVISRRNQIKRKIRNAERSQSA